MATFDELVSELVYLKQSAEELSSMLGSSGTGLHQNAGAIAVLAGQHSGSGKKAAAIIDMAAQSIVKSAGIIGTLPRTCDNCLAQLSK